MTTPERTNTSDYSYPRWRTVNLMPGNVIVACNVCDRRVRGLTAADTLAAIKRHLAEHNAQRPSDV